MPTLRRCINHLTSTLARRLLSPGDLGQRWGMNTGSLKNWRAQGKGPRYIALGDGLRPRIFYDVADVEEYERKHGR